MRISVVTKPGSLPPGVVRKMDDVFRTDRKRKAVQRRGGRAVGSFLKKYHRIYGRAGKWEDPSLPTHGRGRKRTRFASDIVKRWGEPEVSSRAVEITNHDPRLHLKVYGGSVRPAAGGALTIPMRPDAHGRTVAEWKSIYPERRLFVPRGSNVLAFSNAAGELQVAYALFKRAHHRPWPDALPDDRRILDTYWYEGILPELDKALAKPSSKDGI